MGESDIRHPQSYPCIREVCIVLLEIERVRTRQKAKKSRRRTLCTLRILFSFLTKLLPSIFSKVYIRERYNHTLGDVNIVH